MPNSPAETVATLLAEVEQCHQDVTDYVREEVWLVGDFGPGLELSAPLVIEEAGGSARLDLRAELERPAEDAAGPPFVLGFTVSVEVTDSGFRVTSRVEVRLDEPTAGHRPGVQVLHEQRSPATGFAAMVAALRSQVSGFRALPDFTAELGSGSAAVRSPIREDGR